MKKYKLIRSNRKTISLKIKNDATLEVRAPFKLVEEEIDKFVRSKEDWINKHIAKVVISSKEKQDFTLNFGDYVRIIGKETIIKPISGDIAKYENDSFLIPKECDFNQIKEIIIQLSKEIAKIYITKRVIFFKEKLEVEPSKVKITNAKKRWGSCSSKNSLNFSWRIIMGDSDVIDYVVVHELAHIKHLNHSKKFWAEVEKILPNYKDTIKKLRKLEEKFSKEDWD